MANPISIWRHPAYFLAFGCGSGALPGMPGTYGTMAAMIPYYWLQDLPLSIYLAVCAIAFVFGVWICEITTRALGEEDYPGIVWDEVVGYWLTMIAAPKGWIWMGLGFVLFRIFDIWKPWPIRQIERNTRGGFGIMIDDVIAAIPAAAMLQLIGFMYSKG